MAEFYPDGESSHRSEKLDIKWSESLIVQIGKNYCGDCRMSLKGAEELIACPAADCETVWKQVIYVETIVPFRHRYLPMVSRAVLPRKETTPSRPEPSFPYPQIGRRAVENTLITCDLL